MIDIEIPWLNEYDTANARQLIADLNTLRNFEEMARWDRRVADEVEHIRAAVRSVEAKRQQAGQSLVQVRRNHEAKPFLARLFSSRHEEERLAAEEPRLRREGQRLAELASQLEAAIDFTPDTPKDLKELLKECRQRKKELQAEKKAVSAQMTAIRVGARQRAATVTPGTQAKEDRRQISLAKESALRPHESEKADFERRVVALDRTIAWLERFK